MKRSLAIIFVASLFLTINNAFGQGYNGGIIEIATIPYKPSNGDSLKVIVYNWFSSFNRSFKCFDMIGYTDSIVNDDLVINAYYNVAGPHFFAFCNHIDTFEVGIFDASTKLIIVNNYDVDGINDIPTDTPSTPYDSDTLILAQIGLQQYGEAKGFEVYPNPAKDKITIKAPQPGLLENLEMLDLSGRKVLNVAHFDPKEILHLPNLPAGIYFLQFEQSGAVFREKLLIQ